MGDLVAALNIRKVITGSISKSQDFWQGGVRCEDSNPVTCSNGVPVRYVGNRRAKGPLCKADRPGTHTHEALHYDARCPVKRMFDAVCHFKRAMFTAGAVHR